MSANHDAIDARWTILLHQLADSMDADCYPDAELVRSAARHIEELTAALRTKLSIDLEDVATTSERLIASERNLYKERAERAEAGWAEVERLLHVNEVAFDEDTNAAVDELNRWRERAVAAAADADQLIVAVSALRQHVAHADFCQTVVPHARFICTCGLIEANDAYQTALQRHDEAMALWFCPEHGGPVDDCEQCIDLRLGGVVRPEDGLKVWGEGTGECT